MVEPSSFSSLVARGDIDTLLCGEPPLAISNSTPLSLAASGEACGDSETIMGFLRPVIPGKDEASLTRDWRVFLWLFKYRMSMGIDFELVAVAGETLAVDTACIRVLPAPRLFLLWWAGGTAEVDLTDN